MRNTENEKEFAKQLFLEGVTRKEIAARLKRTEKTIGKWVTDGKWENLKRSLLVTKEAQINSLYSQLERLNIEVETRPIVYDIPAVLLKPVKLKDENGNESIQWPDYNPSDFPVKISNTPTSKEADIISKLTSAINKLETETSIAEVIEVSKQIILFIQAVDFEFAKRLTNYIDVFILEKMK